MDSSFETLNSTSCLKTANIFAIFIECLSILFPCLAFPEVYDKVIAVHMISLIWSLAYHILPCIRSFKIYRFVSEVLSIVFIMVFIYTVAAIIASSRKYEPAVWLVLIVFFTGPTAFVGFTLLLLLTFDLIEPQFSYNFNDKQARFIYVPVDQMYHLRTPNDKILNPKEETYMI